MSKVTVFNHPLIDHKLSIIRCAKTNTKDFRETVSEIASLMAYEVTRDLKTKDIETVTPIQATITKTLAEEVVIVPILRAGLGMVDGIHQLIPTAKIGHIGLFRNEETLRPECYFVKMPPTLPNATVLLVDPMLATGYSAEAGIRILKERGAKKIIYIGLVGVDEGIATLQKYHP